MTGKFTQLADEVVSGIGLIRGGAPESMKAFGPLSLAATAAGALDPKTKDLMALAIGIAVHCDGCVAYHTRAAHQHGASLRLSLAEIGKVTAAGPGVASVHGLHIWIRADNSCRSLST